ncbi:hypothetical protein AABC73_01745 [Pseudomonas sp. G.S.17]|uniref:hypothetical protein n=1 Tax=Pseudomonas sp. G.S.17 TaxID=3137451 RepID=UPI00311CAEFA
MEQENSATKTHYQNATEFLTDPVKKLYGTQGFGVDPQLQRLIDLVETNDALVSVGITLFTSTGIITGNLISRGAYFEKFGKSFQSALEAAYPEADFGAFGEAFAQNSSSGDDVLDGEYALAPQFIHLDGASSLRESGQWLVKGGGMLWRGKVQCVNGFTLGIFNPS